MPRKDLLFPSLVAAFVPGAWPFILGAAVVDDFRRHKRIKEIEAQLRYLERQEEAEEVYIPFLKEELPVSKEEPLRLKEEPPRDQSQEFFTQFGKYGDYPPGDPRRRTP